MAANAAAEAPAKEKPKSKKLLIIIIAAVVLLAVAGGAGWFFMSRHAADDEEGGSAPAAKAEKKEGPPAFMALDNMVVNLADAGGDKFVQIGVTFQITDAHAEEEVKAFMPAIRNGILLLVSQKTSDDLLTRDGKEKLADEILAATTKVLTGDSGEDEAPAKSKSKAKKKAKPESPVIGVLFSNFIVQ
ncbi:MAG: flagellar basal body-associated FliL family protein [Curvibacter sp.]|nr:flagellar basal body-associated FliL family protein [Curvibacter sp.]